MQELQELPIINQTLDIVLKSSNPTEINREMNFAIQKLKQFRF